jgi:hypothetical protein
MGKQKTKTPAMPQVRESDWVQTRELVVWEVDTEMKRLLLALVMVLCLLVCSVGAMSLNYQDASDLDSMACYGTGGTTCAWTHSTTGGNSYVTVQDAVASKNYYMINKYPSATTYAAATLLGGTAESGFAHYSLILYDGSHTQLYKANLANTGVTGRFEVMMVGGVAKIYKNGILQETSVAISNPSYVGFGVESEGVATYGIAEWDDFVYGASENTYVFGGPESDAYILKKDFVNPAATGLYTANGTVSISSSNMTSTWGKSNITSTGNQTIVLENVDTGTIYGTRYTNLASAGSVSWALADEIFNGGAPYGRYYVTIPGTGAYSEEIWYLGSGATISFDKSTYNADSIATMTYTIDGAYWDTSTYSYSVDIISGTTGATMQSTAISASSGTATYTFTSTDPLGVYYGIVKATKLSDRTVIWMNYDYSELTAFVTIAGYVNDAESQLPISGAVVNITQNSITGTTTTIADGNYSLTNYLAGTPLSINATAAGYSQYYVSFSPLSAKTIALNITLNSTTPAYTGLGIGGVAREGIFSAGTITGGYGRPIQGATVIIKNTSNGETYTKTTSMTGWYLCDEGASCFLTTKRPYDVWGEKLGFDNSPNYTAVAA